MNKFQIPKILIKVIKLNFKYKIKTTSSITPQKKTFNYICIKHKYVTKTISHTCKIISFQIYSHKNYTSII